jgi:uncharacterized protein YutE (UPF0331/DUF86 family)
LVRPEVIRKRLNKLDEYLSILHSLRKYSFSEFVEEPEHYGSAERFLQLAIESITDLGNHVVADLGLGVVNWYSDIPNILADNDYIDKRLKEEWIQIIGFRNVLVHDYLDIDRKIVYEVLQHRLDDLEKLRRVFAQFL